MKKKTSKKAKKNVKMNKIKAIKNDFKIVPLGDRVVLKPILAEEINKTSFGIIIPETVSKEKPEQGVVVAVGTEVKSVKNGEKVMFSRYGFDEVKIDNEEYYIIKEENILAIIK